MRHTEYIPSDPSSADRSSRSTVLLTAEKAERIFTLLIGALKMSGYCLDGYPALKRYEYARYLPVIVRSISISLVKKPKDLELRNLLEACMRFSSLIVDSDTQLDTIIARSNRLTKSLTQTDPVLTKYDKAFVLYLGVLDQIRAREAGELERYFLEGSSLISEAQATLIQRSAERKKKLIKEYTFLTASDFAELIPGRILGTKNMSRTLDRMKQNDDALGMTIGGKLHYPIVQIDPATSDIYPAISKAIRLASAKGLTHWDVFEWMNEPTSITPGGEPVGDARGIPEGLSGVDLIEAIKSKTKDSDRPLEITPTDLLLGGSEDVFENMAEQWFGSEGLDNE